MAFHKGFQPLTSFRAAGNMLRNRQFTLRYIHKVNAQWGSPRNRRGSMPSRQSFRLSLLALCAFAVPVWGQTFYGSIVGSVSDAASAAMAGATVNLTNTNTSERRTAETGADGGYRFV